MSVAVRSIGAWGACRFCGVAVRPGLDRCSLCGAGAPLTAAEVRTAPLRVRRRLFFTGLLRTVIVVGVILGVAYAIVSVVVTGPPTVADPLTTSGTYTIAPSTYSSISGEITGGDYVVGNFTTVAPAGSSIEVVVYNSTEWGALVSGAPATPAYSIAPQPSAAIVYSAPYTDTFYFLFQNPYPVASHLTLTVYVATQYESNVGDDGFG